MMFLLRSLGWALIWLAWWTAKPIFKAIKTKQLHTWKHDEVVGRSCAVAVMFIAGLIIAFHGIV